MKKTVTTFFILVIVFLVGISAYFLERRVTNNTDQYVSLYSSLSQQGPSAVPQLQMAVTDAQKNATPDDVAAAQMLLATAQFERNQGDDREQAAKMLKEIAGDTTLSAATRSSAYSYMANWLYTYGSYDLMKRYVFNTDPYTSYLNDQKGDVTEATVYLLTLANNLQPNAFNNYESAGLLAYKLRGMGIDPSSADQQNAANRALAYIAVGDGLLQDALSTDFYTKNPGAKLFLYSAKAISFATIQPFSSTISNVKVSDAFDTALSAIAPAKNSLPAQFTANNVRLEYAIWLSQVGGTAAVTKITDMAKLMSAADSKRFDAYLQTIQSRPSKSYAKRGVIRAAGLSTEFKSYMISKGWQESDFASK